MDSLSDTCRQRQCGTASVARRCALLCNVVLVVMGGGGRGTEPPGLCSNLVLSPTDGPKDLAVRSQGPRTEPGTSLYGARDLAVRSQEPRCMEPGTSLYGARDLVRSQGPHCTEPGTSLYGVRNPFVRCREPRWTSPHVIGALATKWGTSLCEVKDLGARSQVPLPTDRSLTPRCSRCRTESRSISD